MSSSPLVSRPWRADFAHNLKINSEQQSRLVKEHRKDVNFIFQKLAHHELDIDLALEELLNFGIRPTTEFIRVLDKSKTVEISFSEFILSLTKYDKDNKYPDYNVPSAGTANPRSSIFESENAIANKHTIQRKRIGYSARSTHFNQVHQEDVKPMRKMGEGDEMNFKTKVIKETLFDDTTPLPMFSHSQHDMIKGVEAADVSGLILTSEQREQRNFILQALKRLDLNEISLDEFLDRLYSMGLDLPAEVATELTNSVYAGTADWHKFVKLLDNIVFKTRAVKDRPDTEVIAKTKAVFLEAVRSKGVNSVVELTQLFRSIDANNDGSLSFPEFRKGCAIFGGGLDEVSEESWKLLFRSFDRNGDGVLQYDEFLDAVRGKMNAIRNRAVREAYIRCNKVHGEEISLDVMVAEFFKPEFHPSVVNGTQTARDVTKEFINWFHKMKNFSGSVSENDFLTYYASLSASIESDDAFVYMVRGCWGLSVEDFNRAPPAPMLKQRHGPPVPPPQAKQTHGNVLTWNQEVSDFEKSTSSPPNCKKTVAGYENKNSSTDFVLWKKGLGKKDESTKNDADKLFHGELKSVGGIQIAKGNRKNFSSSHSLLEWKSGTSKGKPLPNDTSTGSASPVGDHASRTVEIKHQNVGFVDDGLRLPYQDEQKLAGLATYSHNKINSVDRYDITSSGQNGNNSSMAFARAKRPPPKDVSGAAGFPAGALAAVNATHLAPFDREYGSGDSQSGIKSVVPLLASASLKQHQSQNAQIADSAAAAATQPSPNKVKSLAEVLKKKNSESTSLASMLSDSSPPPSQSNRMTKNIAR